MPVTPAQSKIATLAVLVSTTAMLQGCSSGGQNAQEEAQASSTSMPAEMSRAVTYSSLRQLERDAQVIVVGQLIGKLQPNPYYGDATTPFVLADFQTTRFLKGEPTADGVVRLSLEGALDVNGAASSTKLARNATYVLFLTEQGPRSPGVYTIVGYKAGIFQQSTNGSFRRVDLESPELPATVRTSDVEGVVASQGN